MLTESTAAELLANFDVARAELVNMLKLRAQNSLNLLMAHVCADLQCLAGVEPPRWPDALSICRIGYRVGRSRSPELAMPVHFLCEGVGIFVSPTLLTSMSSTRGTPWSP